MSSNLLTFIGYNINTFENVFKKDITSFKDFLSEKFDKGYIVFDEFGNEYKKSNLNQIKINNKKNLEYILYNDYNFISKSTNDTLSLKELQDKILIQFKIDDLLTKYLGSKQTMLENTFNICNDINERSDNINIDDDTLKKFEENFSRFSENKECQNYINLINQSSKKIETVSPNYREIFEEVEKMYNQIMNKIIKISDYKFDGGKAHYNTKDINELRNMFNNYDSYFKNKISGIYNCLELIHNLESKLNELVIFAEKINFYINLSEIPTLYEKCKPKLKEELKRRSYFKNIFNKIIEFIQSNFIMKEIEERKKFIKTNCNFSEKTKIDKKTIEILNSLFDFEEEKINEDLKEKIKEYDIANIDGNDTLDDNLKNDSKEDLNFNEDIIKSINDLKNNLNSIMDLIYSNNKGNNISSTDFESDRQNLRNCINSDKFKLEIEEIKKNLRSSSVPELKQKNILNIIENKIIGSLSNLNENNNNNIPNNNNNGNRLSENLEISYWQSELNRSSINEQPNRESQKAGQSFIDKYSKFLWFYYKVCEYLSIYFNTSEKNRDISSQKEDPYLINNLLIEILNENIKLKEMLNKIKISFE
jgi:hypothetical protein